MNKNNNNSLTKTNVGNQTFDFTNHGNIGHYNQNSGNHSDGTYTSVYIGNQHKENDYQFDWRTIRMDMCILSTNEPRYYEMLMNEIFNMKRDARHSISKYPMIRFINETYLVYMGYNPVMVDRMRNVNCDFICYYEGKLLITLKRLVNSGKFKIIFVRQYIKGMGSLVTASHFCSLDSSSERALSIKQKVFVMHHDQLARKDDVPTKIGDFQHTVGMIRIAHKSIFDNLGMEAKPFSDITQLVGYIVCCDRGQPHCVFQPIGSNCRCRDDDPDNRSHYKVICIKCLLCDHWSVQQVNDCRLALINTRRFNIYRHMRKMICRRYCEQFHSIVRGWNHGNDMPIMIDMDDVSDIVSYEANDEDEERLISKVTIIEDAVAKHLGYKQFKNQTLNLKQLGLFNAFEKKVERVCSGTQCYLPILCYEIIEKILKYVIAFEFKGDYSICRMGKIGSRCSAEAIKAPLLSSNKFHYNFGEFNEKYQLYFKVDKKIEMEAEIFDLNVINTWRSFCIYIGNRFPGTKAIWRNFGSHCNMNYSPASEGCNQSAIIHKFTITITAMNNGVSCESKSITDIFGEVFVRCYDRLSRKQRSRKRYNKMLIKVKKIEAYVTKK